MSKKLQAEFRRLTRGMSAPRVAAVLQLKPQTVRLLRCQPARIREHHVEVLRNGRN